MRRKNKNEYNVFNIEDKQNVHQISQIWGFIVVIFVFMIGLATHYNLRDNLPKALKIQDLSSNLDSFIAERAWVDLKMLNQIGPKPTGSHANEVLAVDFLKREISHIIQTKNKNQDIEFNHQVVSGAYWADFKPHGMTNIYRNVQNVIVKLNGEENDSEKKSLMLNCHFDSVAGSPGASDDGASCCVMLEILRTLSRQNRRNKHAIIFLFNGAEETPLQASHGFITQHKWAKDIVAFINLESVGSGGRELLFQSGPNYPWLIKLYGESAFHPSAQAAAEEIFQSGLVPSDTDFRIFRDFGNISGLDFAHVINGYRYHTKYDHIDYIPMSTLQHTGNNILELTKRIANSEELTNKQNDNHGRIVYYDILNFYFVSYSKETAAVLNYIIAILTVLMPYFFLSKTTRGVNRKHIRYEIFLGFLINTICFVGSNAVSFAIAFDLDRVGKSMSWYSNTILTVTTYCAASYLFQLILHTISSQNSKSPLSIALKTQARLNGCNMFWALLAAAITLAGYRISYVIIVPLFVNLITNCIIGGFNLNNSIQKWMYIHLIGQILVVTWGTYYYNLIIGVFIPITGRGGGQKNPDIIIGIICASLTFFTTSFLTPLVILLKKTKHFLFLLLSIILISRFIIIPMTNFSFPYSDDKYHSPAVQRHYITHTIRTLYDDKGNVRYTDSGFWMRELDRNALKTIDSLSAPNIPIKQENNVLCEKEVFCALPTFSCRQLHTGGYWVPGPAPLVRNTAKLTLLNKEQKNAHETNLNFSIKGSYYISLQIRPKPSIELTDWSLLKNVPEKNYFKNQAGYFVMITHGLEADAMNFTLTLKNKLNNNPGNIIDISVVTYHWQYHQEHTPTFSNLLAKMPNWAFAVPSVADIKSYTF